MLPNLHCTVILPLHNHGVDRGHYPSVLAIQTNKATAKLQRQQPDIIVDGVWFPQSPLYLAKYHQGCRGSKRCLRHVAIGFTNSPAFPARGYDVFFTLTSQHKVLYVYCTKRASYRFCCMLILDMRIRHRTVVENAQIFIRVKVRD